MLNKKEYYREYYQKNKERVRRDIKKYQHSEKGKKKIKEYKEKNKEKIRSWHNEYERNLKKKDDTWNLKRNLLGRLRRITKRYLKTGKIKIIIHQTYLNLNLNNLTEHQKIVIGIGGIDYEGIIKYLEPKFPNDFKEEYLKKNPKYVIDHIKPLSDFNFNDSKDIKRAFAPMNHQILTTKQNQSKGNRSNF